MIEDDSASDVNRLVGVVVFWSAEVCLHIIILGLKLLQKMSSFFLELS